jgi:hypothetical protein
MIKIKSLIILLELLKEAFNFNFNVLIYEFKNEKKFPAEGADCQFLV